MKNIIYRYGLYSTAGLIIPGIIIFYSLGGAEAGPDSYGMGEVIGYSTIILACLIVVFGIKKYRDDERGGLISFGQSIKVGALILLFPSMAFALYNIAYVKWMDPEFPEKYYEYSLENAKAGAPLEKHAEIETEMAGQREFFANIPLQTALMFFTVYLIGIIITVVSSFFLAKKGEPGEPHAT